MFLEPQTTIYKWMFGETTISYIDIWNHPIETTIYKWLFGVPGWCHLDSTESTTVRNQQRHDSSFHEQQLSRTESFMASEMKTPLLPESKYEILRDRVLVRWNQMFVCSWNVLGRFNFHFCFWGVMIRDGESHGKSFVQLFRCTRFFSKVSPSDPPPQTAAELWSFHAMCCTEKSAWLVAGGTEGLTLTLAWQEIISPKRLMDDTTHPCFCSRCMVWSLSVEWYIIIFSDVNIRASKPNSGEKAVRSPSRSRQGCGMMVWQDGRWDGHFGWKCHGGVYWVKSQQQMTYTRCNKKCTMETKSEKIEVLKNEPLHSHFVVFQFPCCVFCLFIILCLFGPSDKKSQQNIC